MFAPIKSLSFENIGTSSQGDSDSELIRAQEVSEASNWEGFLPGSGMDFLCMCSE